MRLLAREFVSLAEVRQIEMIRPDLYRLVMPFEVVSVLF
jgi:hypothetical protein